MEVLALGSFKCERISLQSSLILFKLPFAEISGETSFPHAESVDSLA